MSNYHPASTTKQSTFHHCVLLITFLVCHLSACTTVPATDPQLLDAIRWYTGETGMLDEERAKNLLQQAVADGDVVSRMWLARVYAAGRMGYTPEYNLAQAIAEEVIREIERLSGRGHIEAMFLMGTAFAEGLGKSIDDTSAVHWYRLAAEQGHVLAQHHMGNAYAAGFGVEHNDELAVFWWLKAAMAGDAISQYQLGRMYQSGRGVTVSIQEARHWYGEAALRGESRAREALSLLPE